MGRTSRSAEADAYRALYKRTAWQNLRTMAFVRDAYTCQRTGTLCTGRGNDPNAPVAHHKVPHKGDPALFFDLDNIETVAKCVHDTLVQREEVRGYVIGCDETGRPLDPKHPWNSKG